jgi:hypothetical protein
MLAQSKIDRLASEASMLHKAWVLAVAIMGRSAQIRAEYLRIPDYKRCAINALKIQVSDLEQSIESIRPFVVIEKWHSRQLRQVIPWMAKKHDEWMGSGQTIWQLGRVMEVEKVLGRLVHRKRLECPPYGQVLLQGFQGAAIRHPEYHLARDLALINNLFLDAEAIADEHLRQRRPHGTETNQSLARGVILTCYNLLESFVSGIVADFVMNNPDAPEDTLKKLQKPKDRSLKSRFEEVPGLVTGTPQVMESFKDVLGALFGDYQKRRNAFVHCEPGPTTAKESLFHETDAKVVRDTVSLTIQAIRAAWRVVYHTEGPRWLQDRDKNGRFPSIGAGLVETTSPS